MYRDRYIYIDIIYIYIYLRIYYDGEESILH